jgi:hypothetical protein
VRDQGEVLRAMDEKVTPMAPEAKRDVSSGDTGG